MARTNTTKRGKKKILWISEYCVNTGFSRVSESLIKFLCPFYDITVLDIYRTIQGQYTVEYYPIDGDRKNKVSIIGRVSVNDGWALSQAINVIENFDAVFMLQDIWNIKQMLETLYKSGKKLPPVVAYFPIDAVNHDPEWYTYFELIKTAVTYTNFAKEEVVKAVKLVFGEESGPQINKVRVIPHGVDTEVFYPLDIPKPDLRADILRAKDFSKSFIFLNAHRNQTRKRLDITMLAFKMFMQEVGAKADVKLYMHSGNTDQHIDLIKLSNRYGIVENMIITSDKSGIPNCTDADMNRLYNACDVGLNSSMGEGWGLPNVEHAATGKPQIVGAHSANLELYKDSSCLANAPVSFMQDNIMTVAKLVDPSSMAEKMIAMYKDKKVYERAAKSCYKKFTSEEYTWKSISDMWKTVFDAI